LGKTIVTIEGISGKVAEAVLRAWQRLDVVHCGRRSHCFRQIRYRQMPTSTRAWTAISAAAPHPPSHP
jgi:hypothetical protein